MTFNTKFDIGQKVIVFDCGQLLELKIAQVRANKFGTLIYTCYDGMYSLPYAECELFGSREELINFISNAEIRKEVQRRELLPAEKEQDLI